MLLCTDVGNTNIKFALYKGEKLLMKLRFSTNRSKTADDYAVDLYTIFRINNVDVNEINGSIISSVVPIVTDLLGKAIFTVANVESLVVGPGIKTGLDIRLDNPRRRRLGHCMYVRCFKRTVPLPGNRNRNGHCHNHSLYERTQGLLRRSYFAGCADFT